MEFTNEEMVKSLTSLIDETLEEIEEIKKSKFAASEISLGDDKSGIADKSKNGKLEAKKAEEDEEDEDEEDDDMDKADCMDKAEDDMDKADCMDKAEDEEDEEEDEEHEEKKEMKHKKEMKKSLKESESLMKSYVDEKVSSLEKAISRLTNLVESIADAPAPRKGVPAGVAPLHKSTEEQEPLSKSQVANQLFELKKSGKPVDSADIFKVETGSNLTVLEIANKYGLR